PARPAPRSTRAAAPPDPAARRAGRPTATAPTIGARRRASACGSWANRARRNGLAVEWASPLTVVETRRSQCPHTIGDGGGAPSPNSDGAAPASPLTSDAG